MKYNCLPMYFKLRFGLINLAKLILWRLKFILFEVILPSMRIYLIHHTKSESDFKLYLYILNLLNHHLKLGSEYTITLWIYVCILWIPKGYFIDINVGIKAFCLLVYKILPDCYYRTCAGYRCRGGHPSPGSAPSSPRGSWWRTGQLYQRC